MLRLWKPRPSAHDSVLHTLSAFGDEWNNFGDNMLPYIFKAFNIDHSWDSDLKSATCVGIGSVMELVPPDFDGVILGSGAIRSNSSQIPPKNIAAVRGPLTRDMLGQPSGLPLGDFGLLARYIALPPRRLRRYKLGILPHYVDLACVYEHPLARHDDVLLINPLDSVPSILAAMSACDAIISSSLHGLIAADSLKIPNARFRAPTSGRITGGNFKYDDYYGSINHRAAEPIALVPETSLEIARGSCVSRDVELVVAQLCDMLKRVPIPVTPTPATTIPVTPIPVTPTPATPTPKPQPKPRLRRRHPKKRSKARPKPKR